MELKEIHYVRSWVRYIDLMVKAHDEDYKWFGGASPFGFNAWKAYDMEENPTCIYFVDVKGEKRMMTQSLKHTTAEFLLRDIVGVEQAQMSELYEKDTDWGGAQEKKQIRGCPNDRKAL